MKLSKDIKLNNQNVIINDTTFYHVSQITIDDIDTILNDVNIVGKYDNHDKVAVNYINCPCAFDIETSSFTIDDNKYAIMYIWSLNINGLSIYGRTWNEFFTLLHLIHTEYNLNNTFRLVIYVHNLGYEFQFIRKYLNWINVFSRKPRQPMYAICDIGIEFRCSYYLSGYALEEVAKNLTTYKIQKLKGNLDYSKKRHSLTKLTIDEYHYLLNDTLIIEYYIREEIARNGDITKIPLTQTGYVRRLVRENCYDKTDKNKFQAFYKSIHNLRVTTNEYIHLKQAFAGGHAHANAHWARKLTQNVQSIDIKSSYPCVMVAEKFPMTSGEFIELPTENEINNYLETHCCVFEVEFIGIEGITFTEHPISVSKCKIKEGIIEDNGRVVYADRITLAITEIDLSYIKDFYTWDSITIFNMYVYEKGYLPTDIVKTILELYRDKTELKNISDKELEYLHSKQLINSMFGMAVTDIVPDEIIYTKEHIWEAPEWRGLKQNNEKWLQHANKLINDYNNQKQRFLFYPWGVYITSYARRNLFLGIYEFAGDYIYGDTDSIKCVNYDSHTNFIDEYNTSITNRLYEALDYHNLPHELIHPKDKKGKEHYLGTWEKDDFYYEFKTIGAKRYMYQHMNYETNKKEYSFTVAGVNKKDAIPYMIKEAKKRQVSPLVLFTNDFIIPSEHTGKPTVTYIDYEFSGEVTDDDGVTHSFYEKSAVHMTNASYRFSMSQVYLEYLQGLESTEFLT